MLLKIQNVGKKKTKNQKKKLKTTAFPALSAHPPDLAPASWSMDLPCSEPREEEARGWSGNGDLPVVPTTSPSAGLGGVSGVFMYLLHTHQPMQVPTPALQVSVPFAHSPLTPRLLQPLPLTVGSGVKGHLFEISRFPSHGTLTSTSWSSLVLFTSHQGD